jgi:sulfotransferase 6B1
VKTNVRLVTVRKVILKQLHDGLSSSNGFVRKGARAVLAIPRWLAAVRATEADYASLTPSFANSFPKSGTHLLVQILEGLPDRQNFGEFLASGKSSFRFEERSLDESCRLIRKFTPGEVVRGHLYFEPQFAIELNRRHTANYFIYRDPRDVVVSEAHYLRDMNRWHRLHPYFRDAASMEDAIMLSINGLNPQVPTVDYGNIAERFGRYEGWLSDADCLCVRFEDLVSEQQTKLIRQIAEFYAARTQARFELEPTVERMSSLIAPQKSHTFRSGKKAGWQREFTAAHRARFVEVAGDLLVRLGYEPDHAWASAELASK